LAAMNACRADSEVAGAGAATVGVVALPVCEAVQAVRLAMPATTARTGASRVRGCRNDRIERPAPAERAVRKEFIASPELRRLPEHDRAGLRKCKPIVNRAGGAFCKCLCRSEQFLARDGWWMGQRD
jgi:hypothetical protein